MRRWWVGLMVWALLACNATFLNQPDNTPEIPPSPVSTPQADPDWQQLAPGMEYRVLRVAPPYTTRAFDLPAARLDPAQVDFRVHYTPGEWYLMSEWRTRLDGALLIVNANFFNALSNAVGLVASDGQRFGNSFEGFGGMFQVTEQGARVRSLVVEPYAGEPLDQAAQGFPMFIEPGGVAASTGPGFDDPSRRTIIAQDTAGRVLILTTPAGLMTLRETMQWLLQAPLEIDVAFGLDGGKSVGLYVQHPDGDLFYPSLDPIPVVIAAYPR